MFGWLSKMFESKDPARFICRKCPVKRVYDAEADLIVRDNIYFDERHCYIVGNCWRDANAIIRWALSKGIRCETAYVEVRYGDRWIRNGHVLVWPVGSAYYLEYIDGQGIVRFKKKWQKPNRRTLVPVKAVHGED